MPISDWVIWVNLFYVLKKINLFFFWRKSTLHPMLKTNCLREKGYVQYLKKSNMCALWRKASKTVPSHLQPVERNFTLPVDVAFLAWQCSNHWNHSNHRNRTKVYLKSFLLKKSTFFLLRKIKHFSVSPTRKRNFLWRQKIRQEAIFHLFTLLQSPPPFGTFIFVFIIYHDYLYLYNFPLIYPPQVSNPLETFIFVSGWCRPLKT